MNPLQSEDFLFELSWEVCNKVGGIHTVISSKAKVVEDLANNYFLVGVYKENNPVFQELEIPKKFKDSVSNLKKLGIKVHYGTWLITGNPKVFLIEYLGYSDKVNEIKGQLWEHYKIDSLNSSWYDYDEVMLWSWCIGLMIEEFSKQINGNVYVHSHEWMSGCAILYLKSLHDPKYKTIFTTHATMLGRALSSKGINIEHLFGTFEPDAKAYELGVHTKHQTEKALAWASDCFTTVSDITSNEAQEFYGKRADLILYNGFTVTNPSKTMLECYHESRAKTIDFLKGYFYNFYHVDFNNSYLFYTSGRNEFRNKGTDLLLKSLGKLNRQLKKNNSDKIIISLMLIPVGEFNNNPQIIESIKAYENKIPYARNEIAPHSISELPANNEMIEACMKEDLLNRQEDRVKVVIIPIYLDGSNEVCPRKYYEMIQGCDLGIFASLYEPWGYTPLESIAHGVPAITTDLAGFGIYAKKYFFQDLEGLFILTRKGGSESVVANNLTQNLYGFIHSSKNDFYHHKSAAKYLFYHFDWTILIDNYLEAYTYASRK